MVTKSFPLDSRRAKRATDVPRFAKRGRRIMFQYIPKCNKAGWQTNSVFQTASNEISKCNKAWFQAISVFQTAPRFAKWVRRTMVQCILKCCKAGFQTISVFQTAPNEIPTCNKAWFQAISVFQTAPSDVPDLADKRRVDI